MSDQPPADPSSQPSAPDLDSTPDEPEPVETRASWRDTLSSVGLPSTAEGWFTLALVSLATFFVAWNLQPDLVVQDTTPTGGTWVPTCGRRRTSGCCCRSSG